jgi:hypothetical protein
MINIESWGAGDLGVIDLFLPRIPVFTQLRNWRVPFGTQRVKTEGVSKSEDIETNPKADSHPGTNQA